MNEVDIDLLQRINREEIERLRNEARPVPQTIHCTELPEDATGSPIASEWNFYRREVGRLLAEGHEGQWVLIKGEQIIGIWDREEDAYKVARQEYLMQPVLIHQILIREPVLRGPTFFRTCHS